MIEKIKSNNVLPMLINGKSYITEGQMSIINPVTAKAFTSVACCNEDDLNIAVVSARNAFASWSAINYQDRIVFLEKIADIMLANLDELAMLLTTEQGKSLDEARNEISGAVGWLKSMGALEPQVLINHDSEERVSRTFHVPIGVVGAISPWNFPVLLSFWKIAPALAAGNTLVMKPSPFTPVTMLRIGELIKDILPAGVLNIISGNDDLGPLLTAHSDIDKISFTGSTETGKRVMHSAAEGLKHLTLELGGNDAAVVMSDVDIASSAKSLAWAAFRNSGQVCINAKRIYVPADIYQEFSQAFVREVKALKVGDGMDPETMCGPIQNLRQYQRVKELINDSKEQGYKFLTGDEQNYPSQGYFLPLYVIDNPPKFSRIVQEEPFGPIVPLMKYDDLEQLVEDINESDFGLAGSIWSANCDNAAELAMRLQTGTVWINEIHQVSPFEPFSGHKNSGFGVENGLLGLLQYTQIKTVTINRQTTG
jgi:aldehyde dehydrogenase (NAD+)